MQATQPQPAFDERGRALPLPEAEERRRAAEAIQALEDLVNTGDEEEQRETFAALVEALDQNRTSMRTPDATFLRGGFGR
jgi:hypothetical protein